jgi:DNA-binding beta-propeller fold protein YncE
MGTHDVTHLSFKMGTHDVTHLSLGFVVCPHFSNTENNGGISASSLLYPGFVYSDGTKLFVADSGNSRVLVWNTLPTSSGQAADAVIGQPDFSSSAPGRSATQLSYPAGLVVAGGKLYIADQGNTRVLVVPAP